MSRESGSAAYITHAKSVTTQESSQFARERARQSTKGIHVPSSFRLMRQLRQEVNSGSDSRLCPTSHTSRTGNRPLSLDCTRLLVSALTLVIAGCGSSASATPFASGAVRPAPVPSAGPKLVSSSPSVSASGATTPAVSGRILFLRHDEAGVPTYYSVRPDGSELHELEASDPDLLHLSPDGALGVDLFFEEGHYAKILKPDGTLVRTLAPPDANLGLACLEWSPDSTRLACEGWDDTNPERIGVYTVRVSDGGDVRQLTAPADRHHDQSMRYTVDGSQIWYIHSTDAVGAVGEDAGEIGELWAVNADGTDEHRLTTLRVGWSWELSPDGQSLATKSEGKLALLDPADLSRPPELHPIPDGWLWSVAWSPDGANIVVMASVVGHGNSIGTMSADGSHFQLVPTGNAPGQIDLVGWRP